MEPQAIREELTHTLQARAMSQTQFAEKYRLSGSSVNKFLNGHADNPRWKTLVQLRDALADLKKSKRRN